MLLTSRLLTCGAGAAASASGVPWSPCLEALVLEVCVENASYAALQTLRYLVHRLAATDAKPTTTRNLVLFLGEWMSTDHTPLWTLRLH